MIFEIDSSEVEVLLEEVFEENENLPKIIRTQLEEKFGDKRNSEEMNMGFNIFFNMNKIKGGKLHTRLHHSCFEATIGELKVNKKISVKRYQQYCHNFKKSQSATYKFLYQILTEDAMFGTIIAYNTLRRKDEANKLEYFKI